MLSVTVYKLVFDGQIVAGKSLCELKGQRKIDALNLVHVQKTGMDDDAPINIEILKRMVKLI